MKIAISGAQNSGKTTLIKLIKEKGKTKGYIFFDEVVRTLKKEKNISINKVADFDSQVLILERHLENLKEENFITDRCLLDAFVYSHYLYDKALYSKEQMDVFEKLFLKGIDKYDLIFLQDIEGISIEDDGFRSLDIKFREDIHSLFLNILSIFKINYVILEGTINQRYKIFNRSINEKIRKYK